MGLLSTLSADAAAVPWGTVAVDLAKVAFAVLGVFF
ncbi:hypothetical protein B7C42_01632 [Nocardia cerradoensis]|uniref:Uncharacterized protein n=1 Tax=Nocardia cerradoensis TaxID=85688 RepID=A0A231HD70_9NOCA|nr:hypothetical protein B7C42_01632 [Nocardia cerradoensis]